MSRPVFKVVEHMGIAVADPRASAQWYERLLDFKLVYTDDADPPTLLIEHPSGFRLEIMPKTDKPQHQRVVRDPGWLHIALAVDDMAAAAAELEARGLTFDTDFVDAVGGGRIRNFSDPDGNMLQIVQRT